MFSLCKPLVTTQNQRIPYVKSREHRLQASFHLVEESITPMLIIKVFPSCSLQYITKSFQLESLGFRFHLQQSTYKPMNAY